MADYVIKRKKLEPILKAKIELEVDGKVKAYPIEIYPAQALKMNKFVAGMNVEDYETLEKTINYFKENIFKINSKINVSDDEIINAVIALGEALKDTPSPKGN